MRRRNSSRLDQPRSSAAKRRARRSGERRGEMRRGAPRLGDQRAPKGRGEGEGEALRRRERKTAARGDAKPAKGGGDGGGGLSNPKEAVDAAEAAAWRAAEKDFLSAKRRASDVGAYKGSSATARGSAGSSGGRRRGGSPTSDWANSAESLLKGGFRDAQERDGRLSSPVWAASEMGAGGSGRGRGAVEGRSRRPSVTGGRRRRPTAAARSAASSRC